MYIQLCEAKLSFCCNYCFDQLKFFIEDESRILYFSHQGATLLDISEISDSEALFFFFLNIPAADLLFQSESHQIHT